MIFIFGQTAKVKKKSLYLDKLPSLVYFKLYEILVQKLLLINTGSQVMYNYNGL